MIELNKKTAAAASALFNIAKGDWADEKLEVTIDSLTYDDVLDFAEYVEASHLSNALQKDRCDTILRLPDITKYTKKSIIFHIVRCRDLVKKHYAVGEVRPDYQADW